MATHGVLVSLHSFYKALSVYENRFSNLPFKRPFGIQWFGATNIPLEMHHVKKLKNLEGKKRWERFMIARNRKTIAMCEKCHHDLHNGKLD